MCEKFLGDSMQFLHFFDLDKTVQNLWGVGGSGLRGC